MYNVISFCQLCLPLSIRKYIFDPMMDNYINSIFDYFYYLYYPSKFIKLTQIYEVGNKFPITKYRVIELMAKLANNGTHIHTFATIYSDNVNSIQIAKPGTNIFLLFFSNFYSFINKTKHIHDGIVPVNSMFGCTNNISYNSTLNPIIEPDPDIFTNDSLKYNTYIYPYLIDHLSVIGVGDQIYTDQILWDNIMKILNY